MMHEPEKSDVGTSSCEAGEQNHSVKSGSGVGEAKWWRCASLVGSSATDVRWRNG